MKTDLKGILAGYTDKIPVFSALKLMLDEANVPTLVCCSFGKDRTGIITALVLHCLGRSTDYICQDYAKSAVSIQVYYRNIHSYNESKGSTVLKIP